jgi:hypothetical protein
VKIYWSYTHLPELSGFSSRQKKIIWLNLHEWDKSNPKRKDWTRFYLAIIITSFLLGATAGAFSFHDPEVGGLWGGLIGLLAPAPAFYLFGINSRREGLQRYLQSDHFSLLQSNNEVWTQLGVDRQTLAQIAATVSPLNGGVVDLRKGEPANLQSTPSFVNLLLFQALFDHAEKLELSLLDASSETGLRITYAGKGFRHEFHPAHGSLFDPVVVVLCNYASIDYYKKGPVKGRIQTKRPDSCWLLESEDLKKHVLLTKV